MSLGEDQKAMLEAPWPMVFICLITVSLTGEPPLPDADPTRFYRGIQRFHK